MLCVPPPDENCNTYATSGLLVTIVMQHLDSGAVQSFIVASTFRTDQGDGRVAGLSFLHVNMSFCADGGKDFGMQ